LPDALPTGSERAWRTWHFAFHAIPDFPELLITGREHEYLDWFLRRKAVNRQLTPFLTHAYRPRDTVGHERPLRAKSGLSRMSVKSDLVNRHHYQLSGLSC
jgi:hypothetical protein